jgi:hypothetical protein
MRRVTSTLVKYVCALSLMAVPTLAAAQGAPPMAGSQKWYVSPFLGATGGGDATGKGMTVGAAGGWHGAGWWGFEAEVAGTPFFFEQTSFLTERSVKSLSGNVVISMPAGARRVQPYVTGGFGVVWSKLGEAGGFNLVDSTQPAINFGAGLTGSLIDHVGLRGDFRYFRNTGNKDDDNSAFGVEFSKLAFWRVSGGLVVRF